ncbi:hypothetical protein D9615_005195 [Tricholomella constricta]|uniref:Nucleolar 27S pre-rRNA processing Urb2/Npa2 C-terminal domain-containing protein n=1 Tax=Tricholomella constricta TaxID=117010 RepID=A0A8H5H6D4_9AGAR|nr:hypothetical protein D9615_005195 [Tricholomella constricta]
MTSVQTSQGFVRSLKAASDPPVPGGPLKIEIARQVWDDAAFYVPNKAEVVVEWILNKFLKEKDREIASNPVLNHHFWNLLRDVISSSDVKAQETHTRPLKTWLPTLLSRIPFSPAVVSLLDRLGDLDPLPRLSLSQAVSACLAILWPLAAQKLNTEAILECFGAFIDAYNRSHGADENLARVGMVITSSYRNSLWNSSYKKKVYLAFLQGCLPHWLECATRPTSNEPYKSLLDAVYGAGAETLFSLDILRQVRDSRTENNLFETLALVLSSSNLEIYAVLPRLFSSYIDSIKKYRGALVSQGSTQLPGALNAEIQSSGMQFFASCLTLLDARENSAQSWSTRVTLLSLVNQESLFNRTQEDAKIHLNRVIAQALATLEVKTGDGSLVIYAIESLSALARIDYDLIIPLVPRILPKLLLSQGSNAPSLAFLNLILAYHTKTRTTDAYIENLSSSFLPHETTTFLGSPREIYELSLSGPLFEAAHLQYLSKATRTFLTGSQALLTTQATYRFLRGAWDKFNVAESEGDERSPKRRKTMDVNGANSTVSQGHWAVVFSLSAHIAVVAFSSLPMHAVTEATRQELSVVLGDVRDFAHRIVKKAMKVIRQREDDKAWSLSIILAASLRLQYALDISGHVSSPSFDDEKLCKRISDAIQDEKLLPELLVELSRFLLHVSLQREQAASQKAFDHVLTYLEKNFKTSKASWSGQAHQLTLEKKGRRESALALMHMIFERWLSVIESFASTEQLERLIRIMVSINVADSDVISTSGLQAQTLLLQTLHSAQFWELPKFRVVFLEYLDQVTSTLDEGASNVSAASMSKSVAAYRLMLILPVEYFSRSSRADFTRRALVLDCRITDLTMTASTYEHLTILRNFLHRVFSHNNATDQSIQTLCEALDHLMSLEVSLSPASEVFVSATMNLIECLFIDAFKRFEKPSSDATILSMLRAFGQISTNIVEPGAFIIHARSLMRMIRVLESDFKLASLSSELQSSMRQLHQTLLMSVYPQMSVLEIDVASSAELRERQTNLMALWRSLLLFGKWLGVTDIHTASLGSQLVSKIIRERTDSSPSLDGIRVYALAILLEEFHFCPEMDRIRHLDFILAAYISLYRKLEPSARLQVDEYLSKTCSTLSASEFAHILELSSESLNSHCSPEEHTDLLQISAVLLRDHPQGIQPSLNYCINAFAGWHGLIDGPIELRLEVLNFVAQHCSERPAVLRLGDMGSIWTLLTRFLAGSSVHDDQTTLEIFHKIITIISTLIRLRRDLVTHTLPHLGSVLRQLLMSLRTVRPNLGAKQTSLVTNTQPRWLNVKHPLGVEEVKALARLLETLISKSMVRNNASSLDIQKAESLAKPFSKHAAYVLKAYITAMNDPLCLLPSEHRKELQRGLYALCAMMSDHSRDAMMVGALDAGGKTTMKALWKEYEKQRYIGKG